MEPLANDDYDRFKTTAVNHQAWNPRSTQVAQQVMTKLRQALNGLEIEILHMGSTALKIAGKNEIELYVYPTASAWDEAFTILGRLYGEPGYQDDDFCRFDSHFDGFELEILQLRGHAGVVNKALFRYLSENPTLCQEYVAIKRDYSYSKREYQRHKEQFFDRIVRQIPEDYLTS